MTITVFTTAHKNTNISEFHKCIESISNQTVRPDLLVICFDGPVEDAIDECFACLKDVPVKIIRHNKNLGLASAFNSCFNYVNTKYIAKIDSDDWMHPRRLELQSSFMDQNDDIDILGSASYIFSNDLEATFIRSYPYSNNEIYDEFRFKDPINHSAVMFRASVFKKIGLYNPEFLNDQDTELWYRAINSGIKFHNLSEPLTYFRESNTFNRRANKARLFRYIKLRIDIARKLNYGIRSYIYVLFYFIYYFLGSLFFSKHHTRLKRLLSNINSGK